MSKRSLLIALAARLSEDDRDAANELLREIWSRKLDEDDLSELFLMLDDSSDDMANMYGIIHVAETALPETFYYAFARSFAQLSSRSPSWTGLIIARHLSASPASKSVFAAASFLDAMSVWLDAGSKLTFRSICAELRNQGKLGTNIEHELLD